MRRLALSDEARRRVSGCVRRVRVSRSSSDEARRRVQPVESRSLGQPKGSARHNPHTENAAPNRLPCKVRSSYVWRAWTRPGGGCTGRDADLSTAPESSPRFQSSCWLLTPFPVDVLVVHPALCIAEADLTQTHLTQSINGRVQKVNSCTQSSTYCLAIWLTILS